MSGTARQVWSVYGGYALGFVSLFVIWHLAAVYLVGSVLFPPPAVVFRKGWVLARTGVLWEHLWASLQRIQIARALVNEPKMLLMDEPFAALDAQMRSLMQDELARIWHTTRTTVLFITHDIDEAVALGTRIGVMRAGPRSNVKGVIDVSLNGARSRMDDAFLVYYKQVYEMIRDEVAASIARAS